MKAGFAGRPFLQEGGNRRIVLCHCEEWDDEAISSSVLLEIAWGLRPRNDSMQQNMELF